MNLNEELLDAVKEGDLRRVKELLKMGADPNARSERGVAAEIERLKECTPLHVAAYFGRARIAKLLIEQGADVNAKDFSGRTPLHLAALRHNARITQLLLNSGADPLALDAYCRTPLDFMGVGRSPKRLGSLLKAALASTFRGKPERELFEAVAEGDSRKAREALARGANPNVWTGTGATPLHYAAFLGYAEVVRALLEGGAHVDARDRDGRTPLHYAVAGMQAEVIELLLARGANLLVKDRWGLTPVDLAEALSEGEGASAFRCATAFEEAHASARILGTCEKCPYYLRRSGYCALLGVKVLNPAVPPCRAVSASEGVGVDRVKGSEVGFEAADAGFAEKAKPSTLSRNCGKCAYYLRRSEYCALLGVKILDPAAPPCVAQPGEPVKSGVGEPSQQGTQVRLGSPSASPSASRGGARCPRCGSQLVYLKSLGRHYCFNCKNYAP